MRMTTPTAGAAMTTVITITAMAIIMATDTDTDMGMGMGITTMCPRISTAVLRLARRSIWCLWFWS